MKTIKLVTVLLVVLFATGCASTKYVKYEPLGSKDEKACVEENNCIVETDAGEGLLSIGEKTAVIMNFVDENEIQSERTKNRFYDYLITVSNNSDESIYFDPESIPGYNPDAAIAELKSRKNSGMLWALGTVAVGAALGGTEGALAMAQEPFFAQMLVSSGMAADEIKAKQEEFSNTKIFAQEVPAGELIAGRIILASSVVAEDSGEIKQHRLNVDIPVAGDTHTFSFVKELLPETEQ